MITNLVIAVTTLLSTNVTEKITGGCYDYSMTYAVMTWPGCPPPHPWIPREKWVKTEIVQTTTYSFEWKGEKKTAQDVQVLSSKVDKYAEVTSWSLSQTNASWPSDFPAWYPSLNVYGSGYVTNQTVDFTNGVTGAWLTNFVWETFTPK